MIRQFRLGDEVAINRGFNQVFHVERSLSDWAWKFPASAEGRAIFLVERNGEIETHFAGLLLRYQIDQQVHDTLQIVDVYSRDAARLSDDIKKTAEAFFEIYSAEGRCPFVLSFSNARGDRFDGQDLGFESVLDHPVRVFRRPVVPQRYRARRLMYRAELAPDWEPRLDALWQRAGRYYPASMVRDSSFALRRFAGHPHITYHRFLIFPRFLSRPVAWVVFRIDKGCCWWVDLVWDHQYPSALDLAAVLSSRLVAQTGAKEEGLWLEGDPHGLAVLLGLGFEAEPDPNGPGLLVRRLDPNFAACPIKGRAYVTMADTDLM